MSMRPVWEVAKQVVTQYSEDKLARLSASLAYYTIFSLAPLLILVVAIAGLVYGAEAAEGRLFEQIEGFVGAESAATIESMVDSAGREEAGLVMTLIGLAILLVAATTMFVELQDALNTIWKVRPDPRRGFWTTVKSRFLGFGMVLVIAFLLLVSLVVSFVLSFVTAHVSGWLPGAAYLWPILNVGVSLAVITLLFAMIFKILPEAKIAWHDVWIGAGITAVLFTVGREGLGLYLGRSAVDSTYGAAGSAVVLLLWIYYSAMILYIGAEVTEVYANRHGSLVRPGRGALPLTYEARARAGIPDNESVEEASRIRHAHDLAGPRGRGNSNGRPDRSTRYARENGRRSADSASVRSTSGMNLTAALVKWFRGLLTSLLLAILTAIGKMGVRMLRNRLRAGVANRSKRVAVRQQ